MKDIGLKILKTPTFGIFLAFILLCFFIGGIEFLLKEHPVFFKSVNLFNILLQTSINTIIAVGMTFIIITAGIDLSVGSLLALCNVFMGLSMLQLASQSAFIQLALGMGMAFFTGAAVGFFNGFISVHWRIPPFIVTLGMLGVARGSALWAINSQTENLIGRVTNHFSFIGNGTIFGLPFPALIAFSIITIAHFALKYSLFGKYILAIGSNQEAARLCGIKVNFYKTLVYIVGGALVGIAAIIQTSRLGSSNPTIGQGFELYAIAAVIIGGTNLMGGSGTIIGTLIGALIIGVLNNGLTLMNIPDEIKQIIIGLVIIGAVLLDRLRQKKQI